MDAELQEYREYLIEKHNAEFPKFAKDAVHTAPILALLQDPGKSGAEDSQVCSIENNDQTSRNQGKAIMSAGIDTKDIVFWNFYSPFGIEDFGIESQDKWAEEVESLVNCMPKLDVVLVCGEKAWKGMRFVELDKNITLIAAPHPSGRGLARKNAQNKLNNAWTRVAKSIQN